MAAITNLANFQGGAGTTIALVIGTAVAAHEAIIVMAAQSSTGTTVSGVTDTAGNTYSKATSSINPTTAECEIWHCLDPVALSAGATITITFSGSTSRRNGWAYKVDGIATQETQTATDTIGTSTTPSGTTVGSVSSGAAVFGCWTAAGGSYTSTGGSAGWTLDYGATNNAGPQSFSHGVTSGAGAITYSGVTTTSNKWALCIVSYTVAVPSGVTGIAQRGMMEVFN